MNQAGKIFCATLEANELTYKVETEDYSRISCGFRLKNATMKITFFFNEENTNVHLMGHEFLTIPENKVDGMYKVCNSLNKQFRWAKFYIDNDREVMAEDDAVIQLDSCGDECLELLTRLASIVDDAYPTLMKSMWS